MAHFPKPFFKQARHLRNVEIDRKQICLGPDKDAAFQQYHQLMQAPTAKPQPVANPLVAVAEEAYLEWVRTWSKTTSRFQVCWGRAR